MKQPLESKVTNMGESPTAPGWISYLSGRMFLTHSAESRDLSTDLSRCLSTWSLTLLGLGPTIGVGMFVLPGTMIRDVAGPSVVFSVLIACVVTMLNTMLFAEFSTKISQTGAQYIYIYKVFGELPAFLAGSVLILGGILAASSGSRGWSGIIDFYLDNAVHNYTASILGKDVLGMPLPDTPDVLAFILQVGVTIFVCCNIMCTSMVNAVLGLMNSLVLIVVFVCGMIYGNSQNFFNADAGGMFPFGADGVFKAAFLAIYAVSEVEMTAMSAEETEKPAKSLPRAMAATLAIVAALYMSTVVSNLFLSPYWLLDARSPLPSGFAHCGFHWAELVITVATCLGLSNLQIVTLYSTSRAIYRMSKDGLLFSFFLKVDEERDIPMRAVVCAGLVSAVVALLFDITRLIQLTIVAKIVSYTAVASALIRLKISQNETAKAQWPLLGMRNGKEDNTKALSTDCMPKDIREEKSVGLIKSNAKRAESEINGIKCVQKLAQCESINNVDNITNNALKDAENKDDQISSFMGMQNVQGKENYADQAVNNNGGSTQKNLRRDSVYTTMNGTSLILTEPFSSLNNNEKTESLKSEFHGGGVNISQKIPNSSELLRQTILNLQTKRQDSCLKDDSAQENRCIRKSEAEYGSLSGFMYKFNEYWYNCRDVSDSQTKSADLQNSDNTFASRAVLWLSPVIPGVLSCNVLVLLHFLSCVTLATLINYSCRSGSQPGAVIVTSLVACVVVVFSLSLWPFCNESGGDNDGNFQTPAMPLIPTLSIVANTSMLLIGADQDGWIELLAVVLLAFIGYLVMTYFQYVKERDSDEKGEETTLISVNGYHETRPVQNGGYHLKEQKPN